MGHKWWCAGRHAVPRTYQGDVCEATDHVPPPFAAIEMPVASSDDLAAAAALLGYHPTHSVGTGDPFCGLCATNVTGEDGMLMCPRALPVREIFPTDRTAKLVESVLGPNKPKVGAAYVTNRVVNVQGTKSTWRVEERTSFRTGETYWHCPCPSWKYHGELRCKHTDIARQEQ